MHKMSTVDWHLYRSHAYILSNKPFLENHSSYQPDGTILLMFYRKQNSVFSKARQLCRVTGLGRTEIEMLPIYNSRAALSLFNTASC